MKSNFETSADRNQALSTLGYGIMWFFTAILVGVLPFLTGNGSIVFYLTGTLSFITGVYKTYRGIKQLSST